MTKTKGLLIMDVDSTLIQEEGIDLLGEIAGSGAEIADITSRAMNGELDFAEALAARVGLLKGLPETVFSEVPMHQPPLRPAAPKPANSFSITSTFSAGFVIFR